MEALALAIVFAGVACWPLRAQVGMAIAAMLYGKGGRQ